VVTDFDDADEVPPLVYVGGHMDGQIAPPHFRAIATREPIYITATGGLARDHREESAWYIPVWVTREVAGVREKRAFLVHQPMSEDKVHEQITTNIPKYWR